MLLYYITDRKQFPGDEPSRRTRLLEKMAQAARCGVDFIQLREKDLSGRELESLAGAAVRAIRENSPDAAGKAATRILINSRTDVAIACAADGVHLTSTDVDPGDVRSVWSRGAGAPSSLDRARDFGARLSFQPALSNRVERGGRMGRANASTSPFGSGQVAAREKAVPVIAVSCHAEQEVARAASAGAAFAVFAPVFEKRDFPHLRPAGLEALRDVCRQPIPVLALGGITLENACQCVDAGAAGIAAIRLFQENDIADVVRRLRG